MSYESGVTEDDIEDFENELDIDNQSDADMSESDFEKYVENNSKAKNVRSAGSVYTDEEENEIIKRAQADDQEAWNLIFKKYALFRNYMKFKMGRRIFGKVTPEDLESYIDEGIVTSVREFDESKGAKFFTFLFLTTQHRVMRLNNRNSTKRYQNDVLVQAEMNATSMVSIDAKQKENNKGEGRLLAEVIADTSDAEKQQEDDIAEFATKILGMVKNEIAKDFFEGKANDDSVTYDAIAQKYGISRARVEQLVKRERNNILKIIEKCKKVYTLLAIQKESIEYVASATGISESQVADYLKVYKYLYEHGKQVQQIVNDNTKAKEREHKVDSVKSSRRRSRKKTVTAPSVRHVKSLERITQTDLIKLARKAFPMDKGLQMLNRFEVLGESLGEIAVSSCMTVEEVHQVLINATNFVKEFFENVQKVVEVAQNSESIKNVFTNKQEKLYYDSILRNLLTGNIPKKNPVQVAIYSGLIKGQELLKFEDKSNVLTSLYILGEDCNVIAERLKVTKWYILDVARKLVTALNCVVGKFEEVYEGVKANESFEQISQKTQIPVDNIQSVYEYAKKIFFLNAEDLDLSRYANVKQGADFYTDNAEKVEIVLKKFKPLLTTNGMAEKYDLIVQNIIGGVSLQQLSGGVASRRTSLQGIKRAILESVKINMALTDACHDVMSKGQDVLEFAQGFNLTIEEVEDYAKLYDYFYSDGVLPERFNMENERNKNYWDRKRAKQKEKVGVLSKGLSDEKLEANPQNALGWEGVCEQIEDLTTLTNSISTEEFVRIIKLFAPIYERTSRADVFKRFVYDTYVNNSSIKDICEKNDLNYQTAASGKYVYTREVKCYLTLCKASMLALSGVKEFDEKLKNDLGLNQFQIEQYSNLYSYLYESGEIVNDWMPTNLVPKFKVIEQIQENLNAKVKETIESERVNENTIIQPTIIQPIENAISVETVTIQPVAEQVAESESESVVERNSSTTEVVENVTIEPAPTPKRRGRPKGSKNKKAIARALEESEKSEESNNLQGSEAESQPENLNVEEMNKPSDDVTTEVQVQSVSVVEKIAVKESENKTKSSSEKASAEQEDVKSTRKRMNDIQAFANREIIERLANLYEYDLRMKALKGAVVDNLPKEELVKILGVDDYAVCKSAIIDAEIELLGLLINVKKFVASGSPATSENGYLNWICQYLVGEKTRVYQNYTEQLRIVSILENDLDFMFELGNYKAFLKMGESMSVFAERTGQKFSTIMNRCARAKQYIEEVVRLSKSVYDLRTSNKSDSEICDELNISENEILRYISLYEAIYWGRSVNDFMSREKKDLYLKLFDYIDDGKMFNLQYFLTTKLSIAEIATHNNIGEVDLKREIKQGLAKLDDMLEQIHRAKQNENPEMPKVERLFFTKMYEYLYCGGARPIKLLTESELLIKLRPVYIRDSKFDLWYSNVVEAKELEDIAKAEGIVEGSARNKRAHAKNDLNEVLYQAELCYAEFASDGVVSDKTKTDLGITESRASDLINLYNYLYNDGELIQFETIMPRKERENKSATAINKGNTDQNAMVEHKQRIVKGPQIDKVDLITKLAEMYPYDFRYKVLKNEIVEGISFTESLAWLKLTENEISEVRASIYRDLEGLTTNTIKIGYVKYPRETHSAKAEEFGESEGAVSWYEKVYKYLFKGEEIPKENYLELRRLTKILSECGIQTNNLNFVTNYYNNRKNRERLNSTDQARVVRGRREVMAVLDELASIGEQIRSGVSLVSLAQSRQQTPDKLESLFNIYKYIIVGIKPKMAEKQQVAVEVEQKQPQTVLVREVNIPSSPSSNGASPELKTKEDASSVGMQKFTSEQKSVVIEGSRSEYKQVVQQGLPDGRPYRRMNEGAEVLSYRGQCKAKVFKFLKPKVKKLMTVKYYFDGVDIEIVAKKMGLDIYSAIDHILNTGQRFISEANKRSKSDNTPTPFELYCSIVPFDRDLYEEPLKAQLRYMGTLPTNSLTKLTRAVETVIKSEPIEIRSYLNEKYGKINSKGMIGFDFAEMLSGEDEIVRSLYPKFQQEFTRVLDKSRNTWSM